MIKHGDVMGCFGNMMGYSFIEIYRKGFTSHIDEANHRCPFPIGWLMKKEGFEDLPL